MQSSKCPNIQKRKALSDLVANYGKENKLLMHISQVPTSKPRLEIKKILRSPFGNQPEKYSRQRQIFSRKFV